MERGRTHPFPATGPSLCRPFRSAHTLLRLRGSPLTWEPGGGPLARGILGREREVGDRPGLRGCCPRGGSGFFLWFRSLQVGGFSQPWRCGPLACTNPLSSAPTQPSFSSTHGGLSRSTGDGRSGLSRCWSGWEPPLCQEGMAGGRGPGCREEGEDKRGRGTGRAGDSLCPGMLAARLGGTRGEYWKLAAKPGA